MVVICQVYLIGIFLMEFFSSLFNNGYKQLNNKEDIYQIIPKQVFIYFPIAQGIREEEFEYVSDKLLNYYHKYLKGRYDKNRFMVHFSQDSKVDLMSISENTIDKVKMMKERNKMDPFNEKYQFSPKMKESFQTKPAHIDFLFFNYSFDRFNYPDIYDLSNNFLNFALEFRSSFMDHLFDMLPKFNYLDLYTLYQEIETFNNPEFWKAYEEFWFDFGYDELFSPCYYKRAFFVLDLYQNFGRDLERKHYSLILLRLTKSDLLSKDSYGGIDGIFYILSIADCAINKKSHRKWVIEVLKWYGHREEIVSFCKVNNITYPFLK